MKLSFEGKRQNITGPCETFRKWCDLRHVNYKTMHGRASKGHALPAVELKGHKRCGGEVNYYLIADLDKWLASYGDSK